MEDIRQLVQHLGVATFTLVGTAINKKYQTFWNDRPTNCVDVSRYLHQVGHDWGGAISWTFSALHPGLLDNLVICNCPHMVAIR